MKSIHLIIIGLLISGMSFAQTSVKKVTSQVAIDGQLEESFWDLSNQISINLNGSNNTANFGVLWDDNYLYIGVNVVDGSLNMNEGQSYYDDGVEICIDGNNNLGTSFDQYDRHFVKPINSYWIQEKDGYNENVIHKWMKTNDGYSMEFAIPWNNFNITPTAGMNIGFNIAINDDDDSENRFTFPPQLLWNGTNNYYKDPSVWGTLELSSQTVSYSGNYLAIINPNGGDFYINNKTTDIKWVSNSITNIDIDYSTDNGGSWNTIATNISASLNSYAWTISATPSDQCLIKISATGNPTTNDISENVFTISDPLSNIGPLLKDNWQVFHWPYNAYFPEDPNGLNGHIANVCGNTALSRILHYWEFPIIGNDEITFIDYGGFTWSANFGETTYNYDNMPYYLPENSTQNEFTDAATLFYHAATAQFYEEMHGSSDHNLAYVMSHYFNYTEGVPVLRNAHTRAEWIQILKNELDNGRVLLVAGLTLEVPDTWHETSSAGGHWFICDGYNEEGDFHAAMSFGGGGDDFYDINSFTDFAYNIVMLSGLEPDLNGKELSLTTLNGGGIISAGENAEINWNSTNISNIRIEYTIDNGQSWNIITNSISASTGSYQWTTPNITSDECKIKLTDVSDINVYDKSNAVFSIQPYDLTLISPNGGNYYIQGTSTFINWGNTPVSDIKIEYSSNNGSSWNIITNSISTTSGTYDWTIPNINSNQCKIRITDITNTGVFDESDNTFEIGPANNAGGPYVVDDNTVLLLHFDGNLNEEAHNYTITNHGLAKTYTNSPISDLNTAIHFDNSNSGNQSFISVPYTPELSLTNNWTIEFWLYFNSWDQSHNSWPVPILLPTTGWDSNYFLEVPSSQGQLKYGFKSNDGGAMILSSQGSITTNSWYHIALINEYDNHTVKLILRDTDFQILEEQSASYTAGTTISTGTQDLRIGNGMAGDNYVDGYMDELRISKIVRSFENTGTGIEDKSYGNLISLYPNPSSKNIYISSPEVVDLAIVSLTGQKVIERKNFSIGNIDISGLKKGIYIVRISCSKGIANKKLFVE